MSEARRATGSDLGLIVCLAYAATTGGVVAGLGSPLIYEVSVTRDVPVVDAQWVIIAALLVGAVGTPVVSRLSDGRARKAVLVGVLLAIAVGSALALLPSFAALVATRAVQGFGYSLVPLTVSLAREHLSGTTLARTMAVLSVSVSLGVGLGNPLIGVLVDVGGYRLPFLLVTLVGGSAAWWAARRIPASREEEQSVALDLPGALLLASALVALLLAVARGEVWGWTSAQVLSLVGAGVVLFAGWVAVELRVAEPLVDLRLVAQRTLLAANMVAMLLGVGMFAGASAVLVFVQTPPVGGAGLGQSVRVAGLLMVPMAVTSVVTPPVGLRLARSVGHRLVLATGAAMTAASFGYFAIWHRHILDIVAMMVLMGIGIGLAYAVMPAVIVGATPPDRTGTAMGVNQVVRLAGGSAGGAVVGAVLAGHTPVGAHDPGETGFVMAGVFAACAALVAAVVALILSPRGAARPDAVPTTGVTVDTRPPPP